MMKRILPAMLMSALIGATPALANPATIPATRNGVPVQLRADYVPASQFAAALNDQAPAQAPDQAGEGQAPVDYRDAMLAAGYAADGTRLATEPAPYQPAQYIPVDQAPPANMQAGYQPAGYAPANYGNYPPAGYAQAGYGYPPPLTVVHTRQAVPVAYPVPVAYGVPVGWRGNAWGGHS